MSETKETVMSVDERMLRYRIDDTKFMKFSSATDSPCFYIYPKPGMADELAKISNIDFVMAVYVSHGINLKKHISHWNEKEIEVLYISFNDWSLLDEDQKEFFNKTAPLVGGKDLDQRFVNYINYILVERAKNAQSVQNNGNNGKEK